MMASRYGYQGDTYSYPEVQIRMKVDIFTEGPTAGLTFNQTVNAPPPDGVYPANYGATYPTNAVISSQNPDASRMLPWKDESQDSEQQQEANQENTVRYRKHQGGKSGKKLTKDKSRPHHGSSGSLDSKKSHHSESSEAITTKPPRPKPRRRSRDEVLSGKDLDTTPETESIDLNPPPVRPSKLPGAVSVLPVSVAPSSLSVAPHAKDSASQLVGIKRRERHDPVPLDVVPQDVFINTFEDQTVQRATTTRSQALDLRQSDVAPSDAPRQTPRILRTTEETVTTTQLRYEQYRASLSARRPATHPPPPPKPKMVSAAVQTPKQRVSFDKSPPIPIEQSMESTMDSTSSNCDQFKYIRDDPGADNQVPKEERDQVLLAARPNFSMSRSPNPGLETTIDDPGVVVQATQTDIPPQPKPRKLIMPNPDTTETLIDDPGIPFLPPPPPLEVETVIDDPGLSTEGIQTETLYEDHVSYSTETSVQRSLNHGAPSESYHSDDQHSIHSFPTVFPSKEENSSTSTPSPPPFPVPQEPIQDTSFHSSAELNLSKDSTSYADYVVQHRLMPSAKIFEMYTRGTSPSTTAGGSKSPASSPSRFLQAAESSHPVNRSQEISDNSIDDERSSVSGPTSEKKRFAIKETRTIEETVEKFADDGTSSVTTETRVETSLKSPNSTITSFGRPKSRDTTLLKHALVKTNPALHVPSSRNSIDSERSSISGAVRSGGAYKHGDMGSSLGSVGEENLSDYLQGGMSPVVGKGLVGYAESLQTTDSVISEASIRADKSHEIYDKGPLSSKERSFAEIMGLNLAPRSQEYNPDTKAGIAEARRDFFGTAGSSTSVSSFGSFRQDPIHQATVMTRPPFQPPGAVYGHAQPGTIKSEKNKEIKKVSMSPTSL